MGGASGNYVDFWGSAEVDVASAVLCKMGSARTKAQGVVFNTVTASGTEVEFYNFAIDAYYEDAARTMKLTGGHVDITHELSIRSHFNTDNKRAKLWVYDATLTVAELLLRGGTTTARKVELDIDRDVTVSGATVIAPFADEGGGSTSGVIEVDVAPSKVFDVGELTLASNATLRVNGSTAAVQGKLVSSP